MRIDFDAFLFNMDGTNLKDVTTGKERDCRLSTVCVNALLGENPHNRISGEEKLKRYILATKIYKAGVQEVSAEEVSLMKQLIGEFYPPLITGQSMMMLETTVPELKAAE